MSHSKERQEKICLNCGAELTGRYCQVCGQENTEPKETVWGLVSHFLSDITHFDGKFFSTVKYLISKPGFLSAEYIKGRRASYLHPIRMYVFTSAFFFIIFFSLFNPQNLMKGEDRDKELKALSQASSILREKITHTKDPDVQAAMQRSIEHIDAHALRLQNEIINEKTGDSVKLVKRKLILDSARAKLKANPMLAGELANQLSELDSIKSKKDNDEDPDPAAASINIAGMKFTGRSQVAYDSVQKELPARKRDGWFKRAMEHKAILLNTKWKDDRKEAMALLMERFMHTLPQALFISLPLFALVLLMLYARRDVYYVDHGIFAIHLYCATFLLLLVYFCLDKLQTGSGWGWLKAIEDLLVLGTFFYLYKAMRKFYGQGRLKTVLKFIILNILSIAIVTGLIFLLFILSLLQFS
ncbi:MAG: DUF3667 domain-containing protein [Bacteroidota bacterium]